MGMWISIELNSNQRTTQEMYKYALKYYEDYERTYIDKLDRNTVCIRTKTSYGLDMLDYSFVVNFSKKHPDSIIIMNYADEGPWSMGDRELGNASVFINGEETVIKKIESHGDEVKIHHTHRYSYIDSTIDCLEDHYGYIYKMVHPTMGIKYRGKRKIKSGEKWDDYKGLSVLINNTNKELNVSEFNKHLIHVSDNAADLELMEIKSISLIKAINPDKCLNIAMGSTPKIRKVLYRKIFTNNEEWRFASNIPGALESRLILFFESLNPKEYEELCEEIEELI